jgi:hypothetical protein
MLFSYFVGDDLALVNRMNDLSGLPDLPAIVANPSADIHGLELAGVDYPGFVVSAGWAFHGKFIL